VINSSILFQIFRGVAIALAGGIMSAWLARTHKQLCAFISLGAGTLLGVAVAASRRNVWKRCTGGNSCWRGFGLFPFRLHHQVRLPRLPGVRGQHFDEATTHRLANSPQP